MSGPGLDGTGDRGGHAPHGEPPHRLYDMRGTDAARREIRRPGAYPMPEDERTRAITHLLTATPGGPRLTTVLYDLWCLLGPLVPPEERQRFLAAITQEEP